MITLVETEIGPMPESWMVVELGSLATKISKGSSPRWQGFEYVSAGVLFVRSQNVGSGRMDFTDRVFLSPEFNNQEKRSILENEDILINLVGASIGRVALGSTEIEGANCNQAVGFIRLARDRSLKEFIVHYLLSPKGQQQIFAQQKDIARANLSLLDVRSLKVPVPPSAEAAKIAAVLGLVQRAIEQQERLIALTTELKKALLHKLFTEGLRGERQKQTEIGPVPESWEVTSLGECCTIVSGSLSYTDFSKMDVSDAIGAVDCMAVKVSDMNLPGNETRFVTANLMKRLSPAYASRKLVPANTVIFPKRGAAIATNKKRLTTTWTVLDPNLIGLSAKPLLDPEFLFHWWQTFDLRKITDPGPTPQLNKKDLVPILIPLPRDVEEQREIAAAISVVDSKMSCHRQKHIALSELFRTMLHQLMTAQIRVNDLDLAVLKVNSAKPTYD